MGVHDVKKFALESFGLSVNDFKVLFACLFGLFRLWLLQTDVFWLLFSSSFNLFEIFAIQVDIELISHIEILGSKLY